MALRRCYRHLRVLDLSENIAGPLACMILADLGADVVVESFRPGAAEQMDLGYDDFSVVSPDLIYCSISAFGRGELGHDRPGYDVLVQAFTGIMSLTGSPEGPPARTAPSVLDISTGMWAAMSIMVTLADHPAGSGPIRLESTLIDRGLFMMCHLIVGLLGAGFHPQRLGSAAPSAAPYQEFATCDGSIMIAAGSDRLFEKLCKAMDAGHLAHDERFSTVERRGGRRAELAAELQEILATRSSGYWLTSIAQAGVPVSPVNSLEETVEHPLTKERRLIANARGAGGPPQLRLPLDQARDFPLEAPPALGQHTEEVLREAGFSGDEAGQLARASSPTANGRSVPMNREIMLQRRAALEQSYSPWQSRTTAQLFDTAASDYPHRPFVLGGARPISYAQMRRWSMRLAAGLLAVGVRPGDHVAVDMANFPDLIAVKLAIARIGAVSVAINFQLRRDELAYVLEQSDANVLITMDEFRGLNYLESLDSIAPGWEQNGGGENLPRLRHVFVRAVGAASPARGAQMSCLEQGGADIPDAVVLKATDGVDPGAVSDILYTSGTTGQPKGVMLVHDAVVRMGYSSAFTRAFQDGRRIGYALPMYHVFGYIEATVAALFVGGAVVPFPVFDPASMLEAVARHRVDELICVPAMTSRLLDEARSGHYDLSHLTTVFSSGGAHRPEMWEQMIDVFGVTELFTAYGQTETTASTACTLPDDPITRLQTTNGTIKLAGAGGDPSLGGALAVYKVIATDTGKELPSGEIGELVASGPVISPGYYNKPRETAESRTADGWLRTGDLGRIDEAGYVTMTGRIKESYRFGGELVVPSEVEGVLNRHDSVKDSYVVAVPHDRMGEVGCAFVVPAEGADPQEGELLAHCAALLARFKVPAHILVVDESEIPVTATGKVQKFRLVQRATEAFAKPAETAR
jgi:fatty-acyl-CoA synthase